MTSLVTTTSVVSTRATTLAVRADEAKIAISPKTSPDSMTRSETRSPSMNLKASTWPLAMM